MSGGEPIPFSSAGAFSPVAFSSNLVGGRYRKYKKYTHKKKSRRRRGRSSKGFFSNLFGSTKRSR